MKLFLNLSCFAILCGCFQGGGNTQGNIRESESLLDQAFEDENCSEEVVQSYKDRLEKLKRIYSEGEVAQKIDQTTEMVQKIGC